MDPFIGEKEKEAHMRRMLQFLPLLFVIMIASPHGFIMADPSGHEAAPAVNHGGGQQAFIMNAPNCFIMADGTQKCDTDPTSGSTVALKMVQRNPAVALTCFLRKPKTERPLIVTIRHPALALALLGRSAVRA